MLTTNFAFSFFRKNFINILSAILKFVQVRGKRSRLKKINPFSRALIECQPDFLLFWYLPLLFYHIRFPMLRTSCFREKPGHAGSGIKVICCSFDGIMVPFYNKSVNKYTDKFSVVPVMIILFGSYDRTLLEERRGRDRLIGKAVEPENDYHDRSVIYSAVSGVLGSTQPLGPGRKRLRGDLPPDGGQA